MAGEIAGFILGSLSLIMIGCCVVSRMDKDHLLLSTCPEAVALSLLAGTAVIVVFLQYLLALRITLTREPIMVITGSAAVFSWVDLHARGYFSGFLKKYRCLCRSLSPFELTSTVVLAGSCLFIFVVCISLPIFSWDAVSTWSFKAKIFFFRHTFYTEEYLDPSLGHTLRGYPLLVPLMENYLWQWAGGINEHLVKLYSVALWSALVGVVYTAQRRYFSLPRAYSLTTTCAITLLPVMYINGNGSIPTAMADIPMTLFLTCGVLYVCVYLRDRVRICLLISALASACAVLSKIEGVLTPLLCIGLVAADVVIRRAGFRTAIRAIVLFVAIIVIAAVPWVIMKLSLPVMQEDKFLAFDAGKAVYLFPEIVLRSLKAIFLNVLNYGLIWYFILIAGVFSMLNTKRDRVNMYLFAAGLVYFICIILMMTVGFSLPHSPALDVYVQIAFSRFSFHVIPVLGIAASVSFASLMRGCRR